MIFRFYVDNYQILKFRLMGLFLVDMMEWSLVRANADGEIKSDNSQSDLTGDHTVINANDQELSGVMKTNTLSQSGPAYDREEVKTDKFEQSGDGLIQVTFTFVYYIIFVKNLLQTSYFV